MTLLTDLVRLNCTIHFVYFVTHFIGIWEVVISHTSESVGEMANKLEVEPLRDASLSRN